MSDYGEAEDQARASLRELVKASGPTIFGSPVKEVEDLADSDSAFHVWLDDGSEWQVTIERTSPPR